MIDVFWGNKINYASIKCSCGKTFNAPFNRWIVRCPFCNRKDSIERLRNEFIKNK
jgi:acetone carboxylase gamma subunit